MKLFMISIFTVAMVATFGACGMFALASPPKDDKALYMKYLKEHGKQVDEAKFEKK